LSLGGLTGSDFRARDFVALGTALGVPERATRRALIDLTDRADRWLPELDALPFDRGQVSKLRRVIQHRRSRLTK
jgi:hypothetical protein